MRIRVEGEKEMGTAWLPGYSPFFTHSLVSNIITCLYCLFWWHCTLIYTFCLHEYSSLNHLCTKSFLLWQYCTSTLSLHLTDPGYYWVWWEEVPEADGKVERASNPILYSYEDFARVDHRLKLHCDVVLFHEQQEELLGLVKVRK